VDIRSAAARFGIFLWFITLAFLIFHINKLHILWVAPVAVVLSFMLAPPFMVIPVLSQLVALLTRGYTSIISIGQKPNLMTEK
jgi:hypothetical protein